MEWLRVTKLSSINNDNYLIIVRMNINRIIYNDGTLGILNEPNEIISWMSFHGIRDFKWLSAAPLPHSKPTTAKTNILATFLHPSILAKVISVKAKNIHQ